MPEMKCHRDFKNRDFLLKKITDSVEAEKRWMPAKRRFISLGFGEVTFVERDNAVRGLLSLTKLFNMLPETFAWSVNFLDRFMALVKVRPVHLHCVSLTCLYIAIKLQEEQQFIPDLRALMGSCCKTNMQDPCYSPSDVLRMERKILDKLEWDLNPITPLTLLELYFQAAVLDRCLDPSENTLDVLNQLRNQLDTALGHTPISMNTPSAIALSLISLRLVESPVWIDKLLPSFLEKSNVPYEDYYLCEELVEDMLYGYSQFTDPYNNHFPVFLLKEQPSEGPTDTPPVGSAMSCSSPPADDQPSDQHHTYDQPSDQHHTYDPQWDSTSNPRPSERTSNPGSSGWGSDSNKPTYAAVLARRVSDPDMSVSV